MACEAEEKKFDAAFFFFLRERSNKKTSKMQKKYYSDDKCTNEVNLKRDAVYNMVEGTPYYSRSGSASDAPCSLKYVKKTDYAQLPFPGKTLCITNKDATAQPNNICLKNVRNDGQLLGCSLTRVPDMMQGKSKINCNDEGSSCKQQ